jgi:enoyl-CoA hydratase
MDYSTIEFSINDRIATIALNRPEVLNATNETLKRELASALSEVRERGAARVVILKANGRSFCAGHDLNEKTYRPPFSVPDEWFIEQNAVLETVAMYRRLFWDLPQPVIAQVQGHCLTTGVEMAMQCDLVYVAEDAKIAWRPISGSARYIHMWPWLVGLRRSKELLYTGRWLSGVEAAEMGMVNAAFPVDELDEDVQVIAEQIAQVPLEYLALEKQAVNKCFELMGMWQGIEYSSTLHAIGHRTQVGIDETERIYARPGDWKSAISRRDDRYQNG